MSTTIKTLFAALAFVAAGAHAAPQEVVKLPRVVITGKATTTVIAQLPRVEVTGNAVREVAQLPRVVVVGYSESTLQRQTLAAKSSTPAKRG